jgi:hypothetical protein
VENKISENVKRSFNHSNNADEVMKRGFAEPQQTSSYITVNSGTIFSFPYKNIFYCRECQN